MEPKLLKASNDLIFKRVFGDARNKDILSSFLMSILEIPKEEYEDITILNPETTIEKADDKRSILDLLLHTKNRNIVHIEVQVRNDPSIRGRLLFYVSKKYSSQLSVGEAYSELNKVISILMTGYELTTGNDYHNVYKLMNCKTGEVFSDDLEIHTLEYKKLPIEEDGTMLYNWLKLIKSDSLEERDMLKEKDVAISRAIDELDRISQDAMIREAYDKREMEIMSYNTNLSIARDEGANEKAIEMAKTGLENDVDIATIVLMTGLMKEKIKSLRGDENL